MPDIEQRLISLEAELAQLRQLLAERPSSRPYSDRAEPQSLTVAEAVNRRSLLRKTGVAIAGAAAGGLALTGTQTSPAGAAANDNLILGRDNNSDTATTLLVSDSTPGRGITGSVGATLNLVNEAAGPSPAPLRIGPQTSNTRPTAGSGWSGSLTSNYSTQPSSVSSESTWDGFADLYYCHQGFEKAGSLPGNWGKVHTSSNANFTQFLTTPERLVNTRTSAKPNDDTTNVYALAGAPTDAVGFIGTITVTDTTSPGSYVSVYNGNLADIANPQFSHVNAGLGDTLATGLTVPLGASSSIKVYVFKSCNVLIDVAAWIRTGA